MAPVATSSIATGLLVMATAASVVRAYDPNLPFNYTVPDTARFIRYVSGQGIPETNENDTNWYTRFETTDRPEEKSLFGGGATEHHADSIHPNYMTFSFVGTRAIVNGYAKGFLRGDASNTAEGAPQGTLAINYTSNVRTVNVSTPSGGVLADTGDLPFGTHNIKLTLPEAKAGLWVTNGLTVQTQMQTMANNFSAVPVYTEFAAEGENLNSRWSFSKRGWTADTPFDQAGNLSTMEPWSSYVHATAVGSEGSGASVSIDIPANTSFIVINGTSGPSAGNYFITFESDGASLSHATIITGSAGALWVAPVTLGSATLDPTAKYNITIVGDKGVGALGVSIHSLTYYGGVLDNFPNLPAEAPTSTGAGGATPTGSSSTSGGAAAGTSNSRTNAGAIAGGVVGGIVGLALIIGAIVWFMRRRRQKVNRADPANFVVDDTLDSPNPFTVTESRSEKQSYLTGSQLGQSQSGGSHSGLVHGDNQSRSGGVSSPPSSDGYTSEQLGYLAPPPAVGADSRGFNTLLSPVSPASPMKWTMQGSPTSPAAAASPSSPMASTTTPFAALGTDMGRSVPEGAGGSNLVRSSRTRRPRRHGPRVHQEADGGSLHPDDDGESDEEDDVVLVPPSYDEAWNRGRGGGRSGGNRRDRPRPAQQQPNRSSWTNELAMRLKR